MKATVLAVSRLLRAFALLLVLGPGIAAADSICAPLANVPEAISFLKFPDAWKKNCGTASVGVIDNGVYMPGGVLHPRLNRVRPQMSGFCAVLPCAVPGPIKSSAAPVRQTAR